MFAGLVAFEGSDEGFDSVFGSLLGASVDCGVSGLLTSIIIVKGDLDTRRRFPTRCE